MIPQFGIFPDYVWVDSANFRVKDCLAHPQELREYGPGQWYLQVRLELPDDHTAWSDLEDCSREDAEWIDVIPVAKARLQNGNRYDQTGYFRKEVARQQEAAYRSRIRRAEDRVRQNRIGLAELDAALRH